MRLRRGLAVLTLLCAMPAVSALAQDLLELTLGIECCAGLGCDDGPTGAGPEGCERCASCIHASVLPAVAGVTPLRSPAQRRAITQSVTRTNARDHRAAPFRPPAA